VNLGGSFVLRSAVRHNDGLFALILLVALAPLAIYLLLKWTLPGFELLPFGEPTRNQRFRKLVLGTMGTIAVGLAVLVIWAIIDAHGSVGR
jgi:hypothetical protein